MRIVDIEQRTRLWVTAHADGPYALWLLGLISFFESSILPLPPSAFMLGMVALGDRRKWMYLAAFTTLTSVAGGLFGYLIGAVLYDTLGQFIIEQYHLTEEITKLGILFSDRAFLANFVGAFTPIPYKAFTIASGFFSINLVVFLLASVFGRGLRFFVIAYLAKVFGEHVAHSVFRYVALTTLLAILIIVLVFIFAAV